MPTRWRSITAREAETRLHHAGRSFFTQRFRTTVDKLVGVFQSAAEEIQVTAADLGARNIDVRQRTAHAVDAATAASPISPRLPMPRASSLPSSCSQPPKPPPPRTPPHAP